MTVSRKVAVALEADKIVLDDLYEFIGNIHGAPGDTPIEVEIRPGGMGQRDIISLTATVDKTPDRDLDE